MSIMIFLCVCYTFFLGSLGAVLEILEWFLYIILAVVLLMPPLVLLDECYLARLLCSLYKQLIRYKCYLKLVRPDLITECSRLKIIHTSISDRMVTLIENKACYICVAKKLAVSSLVLSSPTRNVCLDDGCIISFSFTSIGFFQSLPTF